MGFQSDFRSPSARFRPRPFWFWNGEMEDEEIRRQIKEMADKGLGGFFLCARQGLTIPYLSKTWFEKAALACETAKEYGLECWIGDEYPYPSGMAGGEVLVRHPEAVHRNLHWFQIDVTDGETEQDLGPGALLYAKAIPLDQEGRPHWDQTLDLKEHVGILQTTEICQPQSHDLVRRRYFSYGPHHVLRVCLPKGHWRLVAVSEERLTDYKYYGGFFDPCYPEAVRTFIELTHEQYARYMGHEFGKGIKGFFSDEIGFLGKFPWSHRMLEEFPRRKGYDLREHLAALCENDYPGGASIRCDYFEVLNEVFVESYHRQVADWCKKHNLLYATEVPSFRMTTQKYSTVVGGDTGHEKAGTPLEKIYDTYLCGYRYNSKNAASLACQMRRPYAMIESFHSVGWSMTLQDAKWMLDRLGSDGINLFVFHAFCYTIDTLVKYDAPPSQFFQNPYWKYYGKLTDYAGRLSVMNTYTIPDEGIAVLDPAVSLWALLADPLHGFAYGGHSQEEKRILKERLDGWRWICKTILAAQLNYQSLDGEMLCKARIENGTILLGKVRYRVIVIPPISRLEEGAADVLRNFADSGGTVVVFGSPWLSEEVSCHEFQIGQKDEFLAHLRKTLRLPVQIQAVEKVCQGMITSLRRGKNGGRFVFVANQADTPAEFVMQISGDGSGGTTGSVARWNLETGERGIQTTERGEECVKLHMELAPFESCLLELCCAPRRQKRVRVLQQIVLDTSGPMSLTADSPNLCRLDRFELSLDGSDWMETDIPTVVEQLAQTELISARNLCWTGKFGMPKRLSLQYPMTLHYRREFRVNKVSERVSLMMDKSCLSGQCAIRLNGHDIPMENFKPCFCYDHANREVFVTEYLVQGENLLEIDVTAYKDSDGLRGALYLRGDFGVYFRDGMVCVDDAPEKASFTAGYVEGYPYYCGTLEFHTCFAASASEDAAICCDFGNEYRECAELLVNGKSVGVRPFTPYKWNVPGGYLRQGQNDVVLCVTNTLSSALEGLVYDEKQHKVVRTEH